MQDLARIESFDPATGEMIGRVPITPVSAVREAIVRAREAQRAWGAVPIRVRARKLIALERVLARRADDLASMEVKEQGKNQVEAYGAVLTAIHLLRYFRKIAPKVLAPKRVFPLLGLLRVHRIVREPIGVVGVIAPWNYPLTLALDPILAAVIAGNAVVLKPSEHTPHIGLLIGDLFREAGLPECLVQVVTGDASTGAALIEGGIDHLVFTGSVPNGRRVAELAGKHLVSLTLELGGKDAAIVLEDADLDRAALGITWGANLNAGQACLAIERVYVVDSAADRFIARLVEETKKLRVGAGTSEAIEIGAITTEAQLGIIEAHVDDAKARGARVLCGGERIGSGGRFYAPTVLVDVTDDMRVMREETFGPVVAVQRVRDAEEAVRRTNSSPFGLTCSIWTRDLDRAKKLAANIRAGDVAVNEHGAPAGHGEVPWGGVKESGYGRTRGVDGLLEMVVSKHVSWPRISTKREVFWFPYSSRSVRGVRTALVFLYGTWRERFAVLVGRR